MSIAVVLMLLLSLHAVTWGEVTGVYGEDDRRYVECAEDDNVLTKTDYEILAKSICLIVRRPIASPNWSSSVGSPVNYPEDGYTLQLTRIQNRIKDNFVKKYPSYQNYDVSPAIGFYNELVVNGDEFGTGVMVGDRQILTVDHIFKDSKPSEYIAIFNWTETDRYENSTRIVFDSYYCFNIVGYDTFNGQELKQITLNGKDKMDLSIIKTDRTPVKEIAFKDIAVPLEIYNGKNVKQYLVGKELFMIGHSMGLPLVLTDNAFINNEITFNDAKRGIANLVDHTKELTQNQFDRLCFADLDGFPGNSGSPVFVKDYKNKWSVVGIYTGGADDYGEGDNSIGYIVEKKYTKESYERKEIFEHFQILEGMPNFKKICDTDCDYINIVKNSDIQVKKQVNMSGINVTVTLPTGSKFKNGIYIVSFAGGVKNNTSYYTKDGYGKKVNYNNGGLPMGSRKVTMFIPRGVSYNVVMVNTNGTIVHRFNTSGTAPTNSLKTGNSVRATLIDDTPNELRFVPDFNLGESPFIVNFDAYIPDINNVVSCLWDFGDGNTSDAMYPSHTYKKAGVYNVKLTVNYTSIMGPFTNDFTYNNCIEVMDTRRLLILDGDIKKYPIFGIENVKINDRVACKDVNGIMMPVACNGKIEIGRSGECGNLICRGDVFLRDYATVNGDVRTSGNITRQNNVTVTGSSLSKISIPSSVLPLAFPAMDNPVYSAAEMSNNVHLEPGTECELPPGNYGNYYAKRDTKLKLSSGVYYFNEIHMDVGSASLVLDETDGPVEIYIKSYFRMRGTVEHSRSGIDGARNFLIVYYGDRTVDLNCGFSGTVVAPNAEIIMAQSEKYYEGCFYAKSLEIHQDAIIKYIPYAY